ncbi:MAG: transketolase family protein, partial [Coriobacteriales bacterium]|nr:transketolase family protein [Coriobacteriales bacterium]
MSEQTLGFDRQTASKKATRAAYGETLVELVEQGFDVFAVDADLASSTTTAKLAIHDPMRHLNVGIAEQNMIGVAAGIALADQKKIVFTGSFAVFGTGRVYDQIRNTVCYSNLNVKIAPTHAGISTGADGGSHQMIEDLALMRVLPNMRVLVPADYHAAKAVIRVAAESFGPY